jgi:hypothetical protein
MLRLSAELSRIVVAPRDRGVRALPCKEPMLATHLCKKLHATRA